jgi:menaquinone-dependent protoporphyrinogen oxidase
VSKVLVAYATKYGSTGEVAEKIGAALKEKGNDVEVKSVEDAQSIDGFDQIVFGAAFYAGNISKPARNFLVRNQAALTAVPVFLFMLGPITREESEMTGAEEQLDKLLAKYDWLKPVATKVFVGKFDPDMLKWPFSLVTKVKGTPLYGETLRDERDWDDIQKWAASIV